MKLKIQYLQSTHIEWIIGVNKGQEIIQEHIVFLFIKIIVDIVLTDSCLCFHTQINAKCNKKYTRENEENKHLIESRWGNN